MRGRAWVAVSATVSVCALLGAPSVADASAGQIVSGRVPLRQLSADPFTDPASQHRAQVEPDSFAFGSTIVTAFQSGRFFDGGSSDIGWATSRDGGRTWSNGFLSGLTTAKGAGPYDRATDPSVAYDARHGVWLISALGMKENGSPGPAPAIEVSRSTDGAVSWGSPVTVALGTNFDKNWTACDNSPSSPYFGHCYTEYDDVDNVSTLNMAMSADGGATWTPVTVMSSVVGGQPLVQPNGTVIVPIHNNNAASGEIVAFRSTDGGASYTGPVSVGTVQTHEVGGNLRAEALPSAEIDAAGEVYVVWSDCRFRTACASNDLVLSTSTNGTDWSTPTRIPIDDASSTADYFIPGIAVDNTTSGAGAHLALTYYSYPTANCTASTCQLDVGFIASDDGGTTWTKPIALAGPMSLSWLADTSQGPMVGDYISTSFVNHVAWPVFAVAHAPSNGVLDEAMYTTAALPIAQHTTFNCNIRSRANGKYSSAELNYPGALADALRARSSTVGPWEKYQCVAIGTNQWAIKSLANGKYVSAELNYPGALQGTLRARAAAIHSWETFTFSSVSSCACTAVRAANAKFVSAELRYLSPTNGLLRARAASVGPWEQFDITPG